MDKEREICKLCLYIFMKIDLGPSYLGNTELYHHLF